MAVVFPAVGNRYLVDFVKFRVELFFGSVSSLTYTGVAPDGSRGLPSTVAINVESIVDPRSSWSLGRKLIRPASFISKTMTTIPL